MLKPKLTLLDSSPYKTAMLLLSRSKPRALSTASRALLSNKHNEQKNTEESFWGRTFPSLKNSKWRVFPQYFVIKNLRPDKVPSAYKMVYRSELETFANFGMLGAGIFTAAIPVGIYAHLVQEELTTFRMAELSIFCLGSALTIAAIYFLCTKVPLRIYYAHESDDFLIFVPSIVPYKTLKLPTKPGELLPPMNASEYLPWVAIEHTHLPTGQKLLLNGEKFATPMYYNKLLRQ